MIDAERVLALSYAPARSRAAVLALFDLDDTLASILRAARDPMIGQMRLTWWHEALTRLDHAPPPAEPVLTALASEVLPRGVTGARLAGMIDGWEALLDEDTTDAETIARHAALRGVALFGAVAAVLDLPRGDPVAPAGRGWALADLARHLSDGAVAGQALTLAEAPLAAATSACWSRDGRALGALAHLARLDIAVPLNAPRPIGKPSRVLRLIAHRLTGR